MGDPRGRSIYPVNGGSGKSYDRRDYSTLNVPTRTIIPREIYGLADGQPGGRSDEWQQEIPALRDIARTPQPRPTIPIPFSFASPTVQSAQVSPVPVDYAGSLPVPSGPPPRGYIWGTSPEEIMVTGGLF